MLDQNEKALILTEMNLENRNKWFDFKRQKFLHNIDTFYYSVTLKDDFTKETDSVTVKRFRRFFEKKYEEMTYEANFIPYIIDGFNTTMNLKYSSFSFYKIWIEVPERYDIFFAYSVPNKLTCECIVQIRANLLWEKGIIDAYEESFETFKKICKNHNLVIDYVLENRVDYCWHTNYLQKPEEFFRIDKFAPMKITQFKRCRNDFMFKGQDGYEMDYLCMGRRGSKCFVRIYLKSKEVIEKTKKPFFFKRWYDEGVINAYDKYCMEYAFERGNWKQLELARLKFYIEYGYHSNIKARCREFLDQDCPNMDNLIEFADQICPRVHKVMNIEFQTMRKQSKHFILNEREDYDRECPDINQNRIYDYFANLKEIADYLTWWTLRLTDPEDSETKKSERKLCHFWLALRRTRMINVNWTPQKERIKTNYERNLNFEAAKKRVVSAAMLMSIYMNGKNDNDPLQDCADALLIMNDNDMDDARKYKCKKSKSLKDDDLKKIKYDDKRKKYYIFDEDGVIH